jgi:hypothetical protein
MGNTGGDGHWNVMVVWDWHVHWIVGLHWIGLLWIGLHWIALDWIALE